MQDGSGLSKVVGDEKFTWGYSELDVPEMHLERWRRKSERHGSETQAVKPDRDLAYWWNMEPSEEK